MNKKCVTIGLIASVMLMGSAVTLAADDAPKTATTDPAATTTPAPATTPEPAVPATPATATPEPAATTTATPEPAAKEVPAPAMPETVDAPATPKPTAKETPATEIPETVGAPAAPVPANAPESPTTEVPLGAAPAATPTPEPAKVDNSKKTLAKVTCADFLTFEEVIQPKYVIAAEPYAKNAKPKKVIIDVLETEKLVPVIIEECTKAPKASFLSTLKSKVKR